MKYIKEIIANYPDDHILCQVYKNRKLLFANSFLRGLNNALENVFCVCTTAYRDFANNKLRAADGVSFDFHSLIASMCELSIINTFIEKSENKDTFKYEPKLRNDNNKNVEFSIIINKVKYNVEVKSPNLSNYYNELHTKIEKHGSVVRFDTRGFGKPEKENQIGSTDPRVKDFLVDANNKFPNSNIPNELNVLFICWDDNNDQPCIALKHPMHGLLTSRTWYKNGDEKPILFPNIDIIFVSDLYQCIIAHMLSGDEPLPGLITGIPYFENNARFLPYRINPFNIAFARNVAIKPLIDIDESMIFNLPIAFSDQYVQVVDENYVARFGIDIKFSYKS